MVRLTTVLALCGLLASNAFARTGSPNAIESTPVPVDDGPGVFLTSSGTAQALAARETAGPDTFVLYGGPDEPTEGKFQLGDGVTPDWGGGNGLPGGYGGGPQAWTPVDPTKDPVYWNVSTFNAENLNDHGPGNHAMWCGLPAGIPETAGWVDAPGYGNDWYEGLLYESDPVADPAAGQVVDLEFFFNQSAEPGYDFFTVEYDSAGTWTRVFRFDQYSWGEGGTFDPPGARYSDNAFGSIVFAGNDYSLYEGPNDPANRIRIRLLFVSDGGWSDEDGLWATDTGAVQVDDITVTHADGTVFEDFEGVAPYAWVPDQTPFVGDFADVYPMFSDIDPCRENTTPVVGFIDYGQDVRNGPAPDGTTSTGGSQYPGIEYGIPGNWVVNYTGGLGLTYNLDQIWSPEILLDLPGADDDGPAFSGEFLRFDVWADLPLQNMFFYGWAVRYALPGGSWSDWDNRSAVYYHGGTPGWFTDQYDISDLIPSDAEKMQVSLYVWQWHCDFCPPAATPSPVFDNVAVYKYRLPGPVIATRTIDTAQDGFPTVDSIDVSTPTSRDALDIPFSMAQDVNPGVVVITPGDSIVVDVNSVIASATVDDVRMVWALSTNPLFEDAIRAAPARGVDENVVAGAAGTVWTGEVVGSPAANSSGPVAGRWCFDLPDADFMYPGDVLHYYVQATDTDGRVSTLPHDLAGFGQFGPDSIFDRAFTVRGLPTITDPSGAQPATLVVNDFGRRGAEDEFTTSFRNLGLAEGVDYDTYTVQGPTSGESNGIGSAGAHGATPAQLAGYHNLFYFSGDLSSFLLSNGTYQSNNDKGDDLGTLEGWYALGGTRNCAYFGDNLASGLANGSVEGLDHLNAYMGVDLVDDSVRDAIGNQAAPLVTPSAYGSTWFAGEFVAFGGCPQLPSFDQIQPMPGAEAAHWFLDASGLPITDPATGVASVVYPQPGSVRITFPFSITTIQNVVARNVGVSARTALFSQILDLFGTSPGGAPVAAPAAVPVALTAFPNPFNPATVVRFTAPLGAEGSVRVYNLRGELVRTLHEGEFTTQEFTWDGTARGGAAVASGVYLIRAAAAGASYMTKVALVK